jgi:hypothetical protein
VRRLVWDEGRRRREPGEQSRGASLGAGVDMYQESGCGDAHAYCDGGGHRRAGWLIGR